MRLAELGGLRVGLWGFGREGRASMAALTSQPAPPGDIVIVTDAPPSAAERAAAAVVEWRHGPEGIDCLCVTDVVIRSPGISRYREDALRVAAFTRVTTATNLWFAEHAGDEVVAITGSKGKSTTSSLVDHLARAAGLRTVLAGNIGVPLLEHLHPEPAPDLWVLELSSHQTSDLEWSPRIGVLLNLYREHLDWHGSVERYIDDKLNLFAHRRDGVVVLNRQDEATRARAPRLPGRHVWFGDPAGYGEDGRSILWRGERLIDADRLQLQGRHNLLNACAALTALEEAGLDMRSRVAALRDFRPLPHRLEPVGEVGSVTFVNDSIATIPEATIAALDALEGRGVVLIAGGFDRGQDYGALARRLLPERGILAVVTLPPSGDRLGGELRGTAGAPPTVAARDLAEAVRLARERSRPGAVVLLSPAAPSYGAFRDFEERGDAFRALVAGLGGVPADILRSQMDASGAQRQQTDVPNGVAREG
ncbi:MAG: UDP-N-acetylmuramoyl-L-alanine--D-glutamate ligase [Candidatus Dormibacteria bacterium]|jgi:UDP-N-acetylmuramoylalanine--D-glutamate ligase